MSDRELIRPSKAAELLDVHPNTIKRYLAQGVVEGFKLPTGPWRIYRDSVDKLMKAKAPPDLETNPY